MRTNGVLLLHYQPTADTATTIAEHVDAFSAYSQFPVFPVNTALGFPSGLRSLRFDAIVLHFSLFGPPRVLGTWPDGLSAPFKQYVAGQDSYKIAFFQDEHHYCHERFDLLNGCRVDLVHTLLQPQYWSEVYEAHTSVRRFARSLAGYVGTAFVAHARELARPDAERTIDIGYRARRLPYYMGREAQEKSAIGEEFLRRGRSLDLKLDIAVGENARIYGASWPEFLANCRGVIGVEAGTSIFDLDGTAQAECAALLRAQPSLSFEEAHRLLLHRWDGRMYYRTMGPRNFEAAALRTCQILFEGRYEGILEPGRHYLPLKKDFSNFGEVIAAFRREDVRRTIADHAYQDLIASGKWSYERFIAQFDEDLIGRGLRPQRSAPAEAAVRRRLRRGRLIREIRGRMASARYIRFPGRERMARAARRLLDRSSR